MCVCGRGVWGGVEDKTPVKSGGGVYHVYSTYRCGVVIMSTRQAERDPVEELGTR